MEQAEFVGDEKHPFPPVIQNKSLLYVIILFSSVFTAPSATRQKKETVLLELCYVC